MISLIDILKIFRTNYTPSEKEFQETWKSFWHKSERLPIEQVLGLNDSLNEKVNYEEIKDLQAGILFQDVRVDTFNVLPIPPATLPNGDIPQDKWGVYVISEGYYYQFNETANKWSKTPYSEMPKDVVTQNDIATMADVFVQIPLIMANILPDTGIDYTTGEQVAFANATSTIYIDCSKYKYITIRGRQSSIRGVVFVDSQGNKIKPIGSTNFSTLEASGVFEIPKDAIKVSIAYDKSSFELDFYLGKQELAEGVTTIGINSSNFQNIEIARTNGNIYDFNTDYQVSVGLDYSTGALVSLSGANYRTSRYYELEPNTDYELLGRINSASQGVVGYNKYKEIIPRSLFTGATTGAKFGDTLNGIFNTSDDVRYIRFTTADASKNSQNSIILRKVQENLYDKTTNTNRGIDYTTGAWVNGSNLRGVEIDVELNSTYILDGRINLTSQGFVGVDVSGNIIQRSLFTGATTGAKFGDTLNGIFKTGKDVAKVRFTTAYKTNLIDIPIDTQIDNIRLYKIEETSSQRSGVKSINSQDITATYVNRGGVSVNPYLLDSPTDYTDGLGTENNPFTSTDGTAGFRDVISKLTARGGKIRVPNGTYIISNPIYLIQKNIHIEGDIWNYANDPNGVWESNNGTKLKATRQDMPIMALTGSSNLSGGRIAQVGFQGIVANSNTRDLFSISNAGNDCGISMPTARIDQFELYRVAFCGLASGISVTGGSIDACIFDRVNTDGCNVGIYFHPSNTYYAKIKDSIIADCPAQGIHIGKSAIDPHDLQMLNLDGLVLVRNCGAMTDEQLAESEAASALIKNVRFSIIRNCEIDNTGVWWEYFSNADRSRTIHTMIATGLILEGYYNQVINNRINGATGYSLDLRGNNNIVSNNQLYADDSVMITGNNNKIKDCDITSKSAYSIEVSGNSNIIDSCTTDKPIRIVSGNGNRVINCTSSSIQVIIDAGCTNTVLIGFDVGEITDNGVGTIIK